MKFDMSEEIYHLPNLEDVSATCSSCFHQLDIVEHISLLPCFVGRLAQGVCEHLNKKLLRYSDNYRGVLLAYSKPCVQQRHGRILDEQPHIHFDLKYTAYVFRPVIGSVVCGIVNNVGGDHVGCLVYECFNASVFWKSREGKEKRRKNGLFTSKFQLGSKIWFRVISIENVSGILSIIGEYFDVSKFSDGKQSEEDSNSVLPVDSSVDELFTTVSDDKKRRRTSSRSMVSGVGEEKKRTKKKHSKKKKREEESLTEGSQVESEVEHIVEKVTTKKHKKKSKYVELSPDEGEERGKKLPKKRSNSELSSETPKKKKKKLCTDDVPSEEVVSTSKKQHKRKR